MPTATAMRKTSRGSRRTRLSVPIKIPMCTRGMMMSAAIVVALRPVALANVSTSPIASSACAKARIGIAESLGRLARPCGDQVMRRLRARRGFQEFPHREFEDAFPPAFRHAVGALHVKLDDVFVEIGGAHLRRADGAALKRSVGHDEQYAVFVAPELGLPGGDDLLFVLCGVELVDEHIADDVGRFPALEIQRPRAVIERIELRRLKQAVIERVADDVNHVVHLAHISGRDITGNPVAEADRQGGDDRSRQTDRHDREPQRIKNGDHAVRRHAREFERHGDPDRHRQGDIDHGRQCAEDGGQQKAAAQRRRRQIVKERGHHHRHAQASFDQQRGEQDPACKIEIEKTGYRHS